VAGSVGEVPLFVNLEEMNGLIMATVVLVIFGAKEMGVKHLMLPPV
jgi:hypothetical protein